jgi:hypothetical protein
MIDTVLKFGRQVTPVTKGTTWPIEFEKLNIRKTELRCHLHCLNYLRNYYYI